MKYQLGEKDYLEKHHIWGLIHRYIEDNDGKNPEYIIVHPATYHKIIMATNERNDDFNYSVIQLNYQQEKPITTLYGVSFIRSGDVEIDFIIVT